VVATSVPLWATILTAQETSHAPHVLIAMNRLLILIAALGLAAAPVVAQSTVTLDRDANIVTLTLPDGTVHAFSVDADGPVRVIVRDGNVVIDQYDGERSRVFAYGGSDFGDGDFPTSIRLDSLLIGLPEIVRQRVEEVNLPRILVQQEMSAETRRAVVESDRRTRRLAQELRQAERDRDRTRANRLRNDLRQALDEAFDLRQQARAERAERLEEQVRRLEEEAATLRVEQREREASRRAIIERRERELLGDGNVLDW
jgi:hypothetical protein